MNPYAILNVRPGASKREIKKAYRIMARTYHPDINQAPNAEEKFKKINEAYDILMNDKKPSGFDRTGEDPFDFDDIFDTFFGRGRGKR